MSIETTVHYVVHYRYRKVAAGLAETQNGCGGTLRPRLALAGPIEAATHRGAA